MIKFTTCKINIGLNVINRRDDGYHNLSTVMVPVDWGDVLEIVPAKGTETTLTTLGREIQCVPEQNLVMKAYKALNQVKELPPVDIYLQKIVPDGAGLGGGSADAAFTLTLLNEMFNLGLSLDELAEIASTLGADCPLFIYNRPMLATGTGTTLKPVDIDLSGCHILIVKPAESVSTAAAYRGVKPSLWEKPLETMIDDLIKHCPANDFEDSVFPQLPELERIKQIISETGAVMASMSGSGSALYGIYDSMEKARYAKEELQEYGICHICHPVNS